MVDWSSCCSEGQKRGILTENNVLIFSIFASEWGSGRKYLKNEKRAFPSPKGKKKGEWAASPSPSEGGDVPGGVGLGVVVCWWRVLQNLIFLSIYSLISERLNNKKVRKLPLSMMVERNKGKEGKSLSKPVRRRECVWRGRVAASGWVWKILQKRIFLSIYSWISERLNNKKVRKLPLSMMVERNKGKGGWGLPKPLRRRGCTWQGKVRNGGLR